jgi:hypothetical protein
MLLKVLVTVIQEHEGTTLTNVLDEVESNDEEEGCLNRIFLPNKDVNCEDELCYECNQRTREIILGVLSSIK